MIEIAHKIEFFIFDDGGFWNPFSDRIAPVNSEVTSGTYSLIPSYYWDVNHKYRRYELSI